MEVEQHAGFDGLAELHPVDAHEIDELARAAEAERFDRENAAGLRQCLDAGDAGHDRPAGEMALEKGFVHRYRLDRVDRGVLHHRNPTADASSEAHTFELQPLKAGSYLVVMLKKTSD